MKQSGHPEAAIPPYAPTEAIGDLHVRAIAPFRIDLFELIFGNDVVGPLRRPPVGGAVQEVGLEQQDATFRPFACHLRQLAERFEGRAILALINHYREHSQ